MKRITIGSLQRAKFRII